MIVAAFKLIVFFYLQRCEWLWKVLNQFLNQSSTKIFCWLVCTEFKSYLKIVKKIFSHQNQPQESSILSVPLKAIAACKGDGMISSKIKPSAICSKGSDWINIWVFWMSFDRNNKLMCNRLFSIVPNQIRFSNHENLSETAYQILGFRCQISDRNPLEKWQKAYHQKNVKRILRWPLKSTPLSPLESG